MTASPADADYGLLQLGLDDLSDDEVQSRVRRMIARALNTERAVAFVGSGVSVAYGYPSWRELARAVVNRTKCALQESGSSLGPRLETFDRFLQREWPSSDEVHFVLTECGDALQRQSHPLTVHRLIKDELAMVGASSVEKGPLKILIKQLGVRRIITTNYDATCSDALAEFIPGSPLELAECPRPAPLSVLHDVPHLLHAARTGCRADGGASAVYLETRPEALALFAAAAPGYEARVFHCHGTVDDPRTMIVTERDYQRAYLSPAPASRAYRDAMQLLFSASPVIFLGLGLEEQDLLRPLREWVSSQGVLRDRPLFAVVHRPKREDRDWNAERRRLYLRFGLKVLFFDPPSDDPQTVTETFCNTLSEIDGERLAWWERWQRKPILRRYDVPSTNDTFALRRPEQRKTLNFEMPSFNRIRGELCSDPSNGKLILLIGRPGGGKGGAVGKLMDGLGEDMPRYHRRFFASTHFTNDFLSIMDAACSYFGAGRMDDGPISPIRRLRRSLQHAATAGAPILFIVHGVERLLRRVHHLPMVAQTDEPIAQTPLQLGLTQHHFIGRALTSTIGMFLEMIEDVTATTPGVHVVLTSALWPVEIHTKQGNRGAVEIATGGVDVNHFIEQMRPHVTSDTDIDQLLRHFHHALRGHTYALCLTMQLVGKLDREKERIDWLREQFTKMCSMNQTRRPEFIVELAYRQLRPELREVLTATAHFTTPVTEVEVGAIIGTGAASEDGRATDALKDKLEELWESALLERITASSPAFTSSDAAEFSPHTLVRSFVLNHGDRKHNVAGEPQRFVLPSFAEQSDEIQQPTEEAHREATRCFDNVMAATSRTTDRPTLERLLRGAFGIVRARWNFSTIARLEHIPPENAGMFPLPRLDSYFRRLLRLVNGIRLVEKNSWLFCETESRDDIEKPDGLLFSIELGWLLNELGLISYAQGNMYDAQALFRLGQHTAAVAERGSHERHWCQSEINIGTVQLERGRVERARNHFERALEAATDLRDDGLVGLAEGYLGQVSHAGASYRETEALYRNAVSRLQRVGNHRGASLFLRANGDLRRVLGDRVEAQRLLAESAVEAELGQHSDLVHRIAVSRAKLEGHAAAGTRSLIEAIEYAKAAGLTRLEGESYLVMAEFAADEGDLGRATQLAFRSLGTAIAGAQSLSVTAALALYGRIRCRAGDDAGGALVLDAAASLGRFQGYVFMVEQIERERASSSPSCAVRPA